jgi:hypothetical protein
MRRRAAPLPVEVAVAPAERYRAMVDKAAYMVVAEVLGAAPRRGASYIAVNADRRNERPAAAVDDDDSGGRSSGGAGNPRRHVGDRPDLSSAARYRSASHGLPWSLRKVTACFAGIISTAIAMSSPRGAVGGPTRSIAVAVKAVVVGVRQVWPVRRARGRGNAAHQTACRTPDGRPPPRGALARGLPARSHRVRVRRQRVPSRRCGSRPRRTDRGQTAPRRPAPQDGRQPLGRAA